MSAGLSASLYNFHTARRIVGGRHAVHTLSQHMAVFGRLRSALLVTQPSARRLGYADAVAEQLRAMGISVQLIGDVQPEPTADQIKAIRGRISGESFDVYIGIGGGSVLDATKMLAVLATNAEEVEELIGTDRVKRGGVPTILVPTTSGTGSEVTPNAIVTLPGEQLKAGIVSRHLLPELAILDPLLTLELPPAITAATGMDAFTHALESFISNKANPFSDMFALEAIRRISRHLLTSCKEGSNIDSREHMLLGSMYGGMALTAAGTAAVHALAYPLGGKFGIAHGVANSMLLPHVMEYNADAIAERLTHVAHAMGLDDGNGRVVSASWAADRVIATIAEWTRELQIPQNLRDYGVNDEDIPALAASAVKVTRLLDNNPKPLNTEQMQRIYRKLLPPQRS